MKVYALSGPSGTGKSDSALWVADTHNIPTIVDDGLLIHKGQKVAGTSAKYETNYITAIKRATFYDEDHRDEVMKTIRQLKPSKILLIGTSKRMVTFNASRLGLGNIDKHIDIKDVRSPLEIKMALFVRKTQGKHVVPIPSFQVEKSFFKKFIMKGTVVFSNNRIIGSKTIVQPNFQKDSIEIAPNVFVQLVKYKMKSISAISHYSNIKITLDYLPSVNLQVNLELEKESDLMNIVQDIQHEIKESFRNHLNLELYAVNIHISKVRFHSRPRPSTFSNSINKKKSDRRKAL